VTKNVEIDGVNKLEETCTGTVNP